MSIIILGIDPGESAGFAETIDGIRGRIFQGKPDDAMNLLEAALQEYAGNASHTVAVACERFIQGGSKVQSHQPAAQQMVGVVVRTAGRYGVGLGLQSPGDAKRIGQPAAMQRMGLWASAADVGCPDADDVRMALRHAVLYMARHHARLYQRLLVHQPQA